MHLLKQRVLFGLTLVRQSANSIQFASLRTIHLPRDKQGVSFSTCKIWEPPVSPIPEQTELKYSKNLSGTIERYFNYDVLRTELDTDNKDECCAK